MGDTSIEWTDATWNPTKGCEQVSPGCRNCYAKHQAARIVRMAKGKPSKYDSLVTVGPHGDPCWTGEGLFDVETLAQPLRWRAPRRIFVDSMSDLFYEAFTNEQIAAVFGVMAACPQHTFQVLTKRPKRMREWFAWVAERARTHESDVSEVDVVINATDLALSEDSRWAEVTRPRDFGAGTPWPLPNVWLGTSTENQDAADERIPDLLSTPAAVRFLSCEPLLGPLVLRWWLHGVHRRMGDFGVEVATVPKIDWVIVGCESGPGARPCNVEWLRSLRDQCAAAGVSIFVKQAVETADGLVTEGPDEPGGYPAVWCGEGSKRKPGGVIGAPYLDGKQHLAFPEAP